MKRASTGRLVKTERVVVFRGSLTKLVSTAGIARLLVLAAEEPERPILATIACPQGVASEASRVISSIRGIGCPVGTFCRGLQGGAGTVLAAHGKKGFRSALPAATFCFRFEPEPRKQRMTESFSELLVDIVAEDTGQKRERVRSWFESEETFTAAEAQAANIIDHVAQEPVWPGKDDGQ